ncbi:hypothetical protein [Methylomonas sp. AM2-LC]|uniref:hypothetical protein n=1 Tax=Methylomonas sp. AM2-LC TaxID=3153301 RepID=UPI0032670B18
MAKWNLFRHRNSDGSSKDWAVKSNSDGTITTRWGKTASCLPSSGTRSGIIQTVIERQKRNKGYVFVAEVDIDQDGNVSLASQNQNGNLNQQPEADGSPSLQPDNSRSVVDILYWHIECKADHDTCVTLGIEVRRMLGSIQACDDLFPKPEQDWDGWQQLIDHTLNPQAFTQSGQIQQVHGVMPWLLLMALKFKGFVDLEIGMASENSREISADLKAEPEVLAFFGADLEAVRPLAEMLGLLKPKLNLALAMADQDDNWF